MIYGEYQEEARIPPPEIASFSIPRGLPRQATSARKVNGNVILPPKSPNDLLCNSKRSELLQTKILFLLFLVVFCAWVIDSLR